MSTETGADLEDVEAAPHGTEPAGPDGPAEPGAGATSGGRLALVIPAALAVLLAAGIVLALVAFRTNRADEQAAADRREVVSTAQQFTLRLDAVDYEDLDGYRKQVAALLTTKMRTDFEQNYTTFEPAFKAIQITSKGTVLASAVQDIDSDSATVLVIHDVKVTSKGCVQPPYKRMKVDLQKVGGKWLVSDFTEDVPGCQR